MDMQNILTIVGGIAMVGLIVFVYIRSKKGNTDNKVTEFFEFLDTISDKLSDFITEAIEVLKKNPENYDSEDEFYKELIGQAIRIIKELCEQNDVEIKILESIPDEDLENYIYMIVERVIDRVEVKTMLQQKKEVEEKVVEEPAESANLEDIDNALSDFYAE